MFFLYTNLWKLFSVFLCYKDSYFLWLGKNNTLFLTHINSLHVLL